MNRHLIDYAALPDVVLGTPIRASKPQPRDGEWKPLRPGYEARTLASGRQEIRPTDTSLAELASKPLAPPKQKPTTFSDREQAAFEEWLDRTRPDGDCESVQYQWAQSVERAAFLDQEAL